MKYFYSHLIKIDSIIPSLDKIDLSDEEKLHLANLLDSSLHHTILDAILSELSDSDKRVFIRHVTEEMHDEQSSSSSKIWKFLNEKIYGVEDKIKKAAEDLKTELHDDIKEAHKLK
ncbi:MAG: Uncharacterized protein G01um10147_933 [Microgenomates group bacterium Gr01-1014_7]|nr:MAG: Uncharacterized protein G01um10147_933 [Microgenomates group bacterium Gr01-1014_7]